MSLTKSYKKRPVIDDHYDTICIGSGLGSLITANILAKQGHKVLVLEKHYTAGGFTHVFSRPEYEWDVGVHYIGEVNHKGSVMRKLFDYVSNDQLKWADLGEVYDKIIFGDSEYDFVKGVSNFKNKLKAYFPDDERAIDEYVQLLFEVSKAGKTFYAEKVMPEMINKFSSGIMRKKYLKYAEQSTLDVLSKITNNQKLIGVLTGQYGDYGLTPGKSSFVMHAAVAKHYMAHGGAYPVGGSVQFFETIAPDIIAKGGSIITNADVTSILMEDNKAIGVVMKDGKNILGKYIVSGIGIHNTLNGLIPKEHLAKFDVKKINKIPKSVGHLSLYIGFKEDSKSLNLPKSNYWIFPDNYDHDKSVETYLNDPDNEDLPVTYISFPSAKDPDFNNRFPGKSTIEIITLAPYESFAKWEDSRWKKRGPEYDEIKEKLSQKLLAKLYEKLPQLKGKVDYYELSTPLSTKHFANYQEGEIYGLDHTPDRFKIKSLKPRTKIKNFYLTGADILSAGIGGAAIAGVLTAAAIGNKKVMYDIFT